MINLYTFISAIRKKWHSDINRRFCALEAQINTLIKEIYNSREVIEINAAVDDLYAHCDFIHKNESVVTDGDGGKVLEMVYLLDAMFSEGSDYNLGDQIQSIAVRQALDKLFEVKRYKNVYRDGLTNFVSRMPQEKKGIVVMQGWFSWRYDFLPNTSVIPVFIGLHLQKEFTPPNIRKYIREVYVRMPEYFKFAGDIGCRDRDTTRFLSSLGVRSYLSRCCTLLFPKRRETKREGVFVVSDDFIFNKLRSGALKRYDNVEFVCQNVTNDPIPKTSRELLEAAANLIKRYSEEAALVVTDRMHCAYPCIGMGIPVVYIATSPSHDRYKDLSDLIPIWTLEDLYAGKVNFNPVPPDVEPLKTVMFQNLEMSILQHLGYQVNVDELAYIRSRIAGFKILHY